MAVVTTFPGRSDQAFEYSTGPSTIHADLSSRYDVIDGTIGIGLHSFSMLRVRDVNALLEAIRPAAFAVDERMPYWADVWPSSVELARYCLHGGVLSGKTVLELGCGLGLSGIAALAAGAYVIFTDYEPDALLFTRYNALQNIPASIVHSNAEFRLLDWRSAERIEPVDLILGADIVYERGNFQPILNFVARSLTTGGSAVFTDPDRALGMSFFACAEREGFRVSISSCEFPNAAGPRTILLGQVHAGPIR